MIFRIRNVSLLYKLLPVAFDLLLSVAVVFGRVHLSEWREGGGGGGGTRFHTQAQMIAGLAVGFLFGDATMLSSTSFSSRVSRSCPVGESPKIIEESDRNVPVDVDNVIQAEYDFYASRKGELRSGTIVTCIAGRRREQMLNLRILFLPCSLLVSSTPSAFQRSPHLQPSPLTKSQD
eukprot:767009-Hanusia_phi.AAC.10